jgi:hypothetical protein
MLTQQYSKIDNQAFKNINLGLKIMPSYNTRNNVLYMYQTTDV